MKKCGIKLISISFTVVMVVVNILCNVGFFHYLSSLNQTLIYEECDRVSYSVKNKFDQSINQLSLYLERVNREVYRIGYFEQKTERSSNSISIQECTDMLNEFMELPIYLMIIDTTDASAINYSRTMNQAMEEKWENIYRDFIWGG